MSKNLFLDAFELGAKFSEIPLIEPFFCYFEDILETRESFTEFLQQSIIEVDLVRHELIKARDCYSNLAVLLSENRNMLSDVAYLGMLPHDEIEDFLKECLERKVMASKCQILWFDHIRTCFRYTKTGKIANLSANFIQLILDTDTVTIIDFNNNIKDNVIKKKDLGDLEDFLHIKIDNLMIGTLLRDPADTSDILGVLLVINKNKDDVHNDSLVANCFGQEDKVMFNLMRIFSGPILNKACEAEEMKANIDNYNHVLLFGGKLKKCST